MTCRTLRSDDGFTYIAALVMVVIMGIMLGQAASVWSTRMKQERETELIFRGMQYQDAIRRYYGMAPDPYGPTPGAQPTLPITIPSTAPQLRELKDLLQSSSTAGKQRSLRKLYLDPMTGKDFATIVENGRIVGVKSTSEKEPLKQGNFPLELMPDDFEGKKKYSDWLFICYRYPIPGSLGGGISGLKKTSVGGDQSGGGKQSAP
jgi:type II secretory pathway pseudopilin PulG